MTRPAIAAELAAELDRRPGGAAGAEGPRPRAARGVVDVRRPGARVHGRRPVDRPRRARPARRAADLRPLGPRHRDPAGPRRAGGARPQARDHLALLQPDPEIHARRRVLRRAVRLQGGPRRRRAPRCCRTSPTPAGSSTPNCWCWPSAAGCASTKSRWTGSTTPTAGSTSWPPRPPTSRASRGCCAASPRLHTGANAIAAQLGSSRRSAAPGSLLRQAVRFASVGVASTAAYLLLFMLLHGSLGAQAANLIALLRHRDRQHRGQPPLHLRRRAAAAARRATTSKG